MRVHLGLPTVAGFGRLVTHTAPGILTQESTVDAEVADALRAAATVELVRPYHGVVVHGDMSGDLGAAYPEAPRPDLTAVTTAAVLSAAGRRVVVRDLNATRQQYDPAPADVRLVKIQLATWEADLEFAGGLAAADPATPVALFGATVGHLPDAADHRAVRGDAPTAIAALFDVGDIHIGRAYELFPLSHYRSGSGPIRVHLQASRGCNRTCRYCPYIRTLGRWSGREPDAIGQDAARLVELGVTEIQFRDQDFASDRDHAVEVARAVGRAGRGVLRWSVEGNLDRMSPEVLRALRDGGASEVIVGIESVDRAVLRSARRRVPADLASMIAEVRAADLRVRGLFMIGLPEDSWERLLATVTMAIDLDLDAAQFNAYSPLPGERFGNSETATVHDFVPFGNDFRYRTCEHMSQQEVRFGRALATAAFEAHRAGDSSLRDHHLARIRLRAEGRAA